MAQTAIVIYMRGHAETICENARVWERLRDI